MQTFTSGLIKAIPGLLGCRPWVLFQRLCPLSRDVGWRPSFGNGKGAGRGILAEANCPYIEYNNNVVPLPGRKMPQLQQPRVHSSSTHIVKTGSWGTGLPNPLPHYNPNLCNVLARAHQPYWLGCTGTSKSKTKQRACNLLHQWQTRHFLGLGSQKKGNQNGCTTFAPQGLQCGENLKWPLALGSVLQGGIKRAACGAHGFLIPMSF